MAYRTDGTNADSIVAASAVDLTAYKCLAISGWFWVNTFATNTQSLFCTVASPFGIGKAIQIEARNDFWSTTNPHVVFSNDPNEHTAFSVDTQVASVDRAADPHRERDADPPAKRAKPSRPFQKSKLTPESLNADYQYLEKRLNDYYHSDLGPNPTSAINRLAGKIALFLDDEANLAFYRKFCDPFRYMLELERCSEISGPLIAALAVPSDRWIAFRDEAIVVQKSKGAFAKSARTSVEPASLAL
jgi:hypothetical protein